MLDHSEGFQSAACLLHRSAERSKGINCSLEHDLIVINDQDINGFELHVVTLPVSNGDIKSDGEGRSLALFALTIYRSADQIDHLLGYGQTETGSLNAVNAAVHLTGERLVHAGHEFRTHSDARIGHNIGQLY